VVHEFDPRVELPWTVSADEHARIRRELAGGRAVIGSVLARKLQIVPGDTLRLELEGRSLSVQVAAVVRDYTLGGLGVYLDRAPAAELITQGPAETYTVTLKPGTALEPAMDELKALVGGEGLVVSSYAQLRGELDMLIGGVVAALWALIAVGFVIGGIAVANTLTMSVLEQTRELGLLRIVGMTQAQVRRLVACESLLLGLLGALMGSIAGVTTAWIIHLCSGPLLGQAAPFEFHAWLLLANLGGCLLITLVAAWSPGSRAARMNLLEAIALE
jgi:putative ABC transport system permease protein